MNPIRKGRLAWLCLVALAAAAAAEQEKGKDEKAPRISGEWAGKWGAYTPPKEGEAPPPDKYSQKQLRLEARVAEPKDGAWDATFEGDCGRPYKYTIKMTGRQAGDAVLFSGRVDLGEEDGGVYDWIGRATEQEFIGFYTSRKYTGQFRLARPKEAKPPK